MKKLIIVSGSQGTGNRIANQLKSITGEKFDIKVIIMSNVYKSDLKCNLVLFTSDFIAKITYKYFDQSTPYLIARRVIDHKNIKDVISLPVGTRVLLVNDSEQAALQAIMQLLEIGLDHVQYYPFYPGCVDYPKLEIAITPGEADLSPHCVKHLINIGTRILDIGTIYEIISTFGITGVLNESLVTEYIKDIVEISKSIDKNRKSAIESKKLLEAIVNNVEYGIIYIDNDGKIISINSKIKSMFGKKRKDLLTKEISKLIDTIDIFNNKNNSFITNIEGKEVLIDVDEITFQEKSGYLITINYTDKIAKLDHKIRRNYEKRIAQKFYTFEDYLTITEEVKDILRKAAKFSKTNATILIQGENGTGKEIIAQSVHMNSYRRKNAFIPVNITAITPTLLESELFGYEKGSFTGAKEEGKAGLFEIANGGTIFIDEVGDAPLDFQVKLLRVLEEKKIRRIGGVEEIPIDIRVIAATNKNLIKLISEGKFREDLFFRINILPLKTIPLRYRKKDIPYLLMHFISIYFNNKNIKTLDDLFEKTAKDFLKNYNWRGNVRELINLVEYLSIIYEGKKFPLYSLPHHMMESMYESKRIILDINELWVLKEIEKNNGIGRSKLAQHAKNQNLDLGEGKIRSIIKKLKEKNLIASKDGKRGLTINKLGLKALEEYK